MPVRHRQSTNTTTKLKTVQANSFSRLAFGEESSSIDPETPEKAIISVFKSYLVNLGSFKRHILYFVQVLSRKFEVIEENRTKPNSLLSAFLQTDQMWPLMWSSGFHFCLLRLSSQRSTFDGYFLDDKYVKRVKNGFLDTAVVY